MSNEKAIVPLDVNVPKVPEPKPVELAQVEARAISKFAEASMIEYTDAEKKILFAPIDPKDIKIRPDGQIYLEWSWCADRLDAAFGQGQWALSPAPFNPKLYREGNITYREYVLWIRGSFVANAVGHHEEQRRTANFGDAAEATYANALTRCCKRIGMARDLWKKDKIEEFKKLLKSGSTSEKAKATGAEDSPTPPLVKASLESSPVAPSSNGELMEKANKMTNTFYKDYGIGQTQIETFLQREKQAWTAADIDVMKGVYQKLRKGASVDEFFGERTEA